MATRERDLWALNEGGGGYQEIYDGLGELREAFHSHGRLDDSNAKLDEVVKLLSTYVAQRRGLIDGFPDLGEDAAGKRGRAGVVEKLQASFKAAAALPCYRRSDGSSVFGKNLELALDVGDEVLAAALVKTVTGAVDHAFAARAEGTTFDLLNESFGHFVRDNFRSNIEDAQYLTPPEVVDFMVDVALHDMESDQGSTRKRDVTVVDPCCGVGSFLATFWNRSRKRSKGGPRHVRLVGQDKVERMVRLASINLGLFEDVEHQITIGNSLRIGSGLDTVDGRVDLILTNPPFGARFSREEVLANGSAFFPVLGSVSLPDGQLDSELLFIDRCLSLLRPSGRLLIVVPDGVVSAKGLPALLRSLIGTVASIRMIVELPPVTFAQAGTRTRTVVLYLQKHGGSARDSSPVFVGRAENLGFEVTSRKGVQVKALDGENDLPQLLSAYKKGHAAKVLGGHAVISRSPSAVVVNAEAFGDSSWTPSHLSAARFAAMDEMKAVRDLVARPLREVADLQSDDRRAVKATSAHAFISVLHVIGDGLLDIAAIMSYCPKTPGLPVKPGELLVSRINPRIPRVVVVPDLGRPTLCSSEFEIIVPKAGRDAYELAFYLLSPQVMAQIGSLTTGTSASHNRVRSKDLGEVLVPAPGNGTKVGRELHRLASDYRDSSVAMMKASVGIYKTRRLFETALSRAGEESPA